MRARFSLTQAIKATVFYQYTKFKNRKTALEQADKAKFEFEKVLTPVWLPGSENWEAVNACQLKIDGHPIFYAFSGGMKRVEIFDGATHQYIGSLSAKKYVMAHAHQAIVDSKCKQPSDIDNDKMMELLNGIFQHQDFAFDIAVYIFKRYTDWHGFMATMTSIKAGYEEVIGAMPTKAPKFTPNK